MAGWTPAEVFPPGDYIKEEMDARGWVQQDLADILGKTVAAVNELLSGKRSVTPETAQVLEQAFGIDTATWLKLEAVWQAGKLPPAKDEQVALRAKLREKVPLREMLRRGWITPGDEQSLERSVTAFLEIESLDDEPAWANSYAARKSSSYDSSSPGELAWLARARHLARAVRVGSRFDPKSRTRLIADIRALARNPEDARRLPRLLADYGIRLVVIEKLNRTRVDGACFWLDDNSPVIVLSLRYDRMDYFWFTLLHELGHIFEEDSHGCHVESDLFGADRTEDKPEREHAADHFAASALVDQEKLSDFIVRVGPIYNVMNIRGFARLQEIHPGIVVGQLQHRREIDWSHHRTFLEKIRDVVTNAALTDGWGATLPSVG